jgi:hypothetical protein
MSDHHVRFDDKWTPVPDAGCWLWMGASTNGGYGRFAVDGVPRLAHRVAWGMTYGEIPDGLMVCHKCDTPSCVNPGHLFLGTRSDNMRDMAAKGRGADARGERNCKAKLTPDDVRRIRADTGTHKQIADAYGVSEPAIYKIKNGRTWGHVQ